MPQQFRASVAIDLTGNPFEAAALTVKCGAFMNGVAKLLDEHKLTGVVTHEIVTPRVPKAAAAPPTPPVPPTSDAETLNLVAAGVNEATQTPAPTPIGRHRDHRSGSSVDAA